jgi:hypothetical protein
MHSGGRRLFHSTLLLQRRTFMSLWKRGSSFCSSRRSHRRHNQKRLHVEQLEARTLLSAYPVTPIEARHAYGFDLLSGNGAGTTIAIVDAFDDPNILSDLKTFDKKYGLADPNFTKATPQGQPAGDTGWGVEMSLDVEWAHAIAQGANILLVEALDNSFTNLFNAVDYAATQAGTVVVSMSWGSTEFPGENSYDSNFTTSGVTFVASSGDSGSVVSYPAASPNVLAVGGTTLRIDSSGKWLGETGWSGSGGGISSQESKPTYQTNVPQSATQRTSPDVAYDANLSTGFSVYDSYGYPGYLQVGGTSAGAPQWAALIAIADQGRSTPLSSSGTLNGLYSLLNSKNQIDTTKLHDITSGSSGKYKAAAGYDLVTGLGSPKANTLVPFLQTVAASVVTPATSSASKPNNAALANVRAKSHDVLADTSAGQQSLTLLLSAAPNYASNLVATPSYAGAALPVNVTAPASTAAVLPSRASVGGTDSGGGDNALISDSDNLEDTQPVVAPASPAAPKVIPPQQLIPAQESGQAGPTAALAPWRQACTLWFAQEQEATMAVPLPSKSQEPQVEPGAALAGLAILLGSYWRLQQEDEDPRRRDALPK